MNFVTVLGVYFNERQRDRDCSEVLFSKTRNEIAKYQKIPASIVGPV